MKTLAGIGKLAAAGLLGLVLLLALAFALLQTPLGKATLAAALGRFLSSPGQPATVEHITGLVPFDMRIAQVALADAQGRRLTLSGARLRIAPADLLAGRLTLSLSAEALDLQRLSQNSSGLDLSPLLHPPLAIDLKSLTISRLHLGPAVAGEPVTLTLAARGDIGGGDAHADLDLHRIDGKTGSATLHLALGGKPLRLDLAGDIAEPGGQLLAEALGRPEPLPLSLHLAGAGPLADWHGTLSATAGRDNTVAAEFRVIGDHGYRLVAAGDARIGGLLPAAARPLFAGETRYTLDMTFAQNAVTLDRLDISAQGGTLAGQGRFERQNTALTGAATLAVPDLAPAGPWFGSKITGSAEAELSLGGTLAAPIAHLRLTGDRIAFAGGRLEGIEAELELRPQGDPRLPATPIDITAAGEARGIAGASGTLAYRLGEALDWHAAGRLDRAAGQFALSDLTLLDAGSAATVAGSFARTGGAGQLRLDVPDISRFAGAANAGALALAADFRISADGAGTATLSGNLHPADRASRLAALLGDDAMIGGRVERTADGALDISGLTLAGADLHLDAQARVTADHAIAGDFRLDIPRLDALAALRGAAEMTGKLSGTAEKPAVTATLTGKGIAAGTFRAERIEAQLDAPDLMAGRAQLSASFAAEGFSGSAGAEAVLTPGQSLRLSPLRLDAAGTHVAGALTYRFANAGIAGEITGAARDLRPWSAVLGKPVAGNAQFKASLAGDSRRRTADVTLSGTGLSWGAALRAQSIAATAQLSGTPARPAGKAELRLVGAAFGAAAVDRLRLTAASDRSGRFAIDAAAQGAYRESFDFAAGAALTIEGKRAELRLDRLAGKLGNQAVALHRPVRITREASEIAFADLDLGLGKGRLSGAGALRGDTLSLHLLAEALPVKNLAGAFGQNDVAGVLGFEATLSGTRTRPQGEVIVDGENLRFAAASRPDLPPLGLVVSAVWRGDRVSVRGRLAGPNNAAIGFTGAVPLILDPKSLAPHLPRAGALALHLEGDGELANLVDLLPLGEDRLSGRFVIDVTVGGTVGAPTASGQLSLRNGRYESLAAGTVLTGVSFELVGNRDRLVLRSFTGGDGEGGSVVLSGAVNLAAAEGPSLAFAGSLKDFRAIRRDEATARASGELRLTGEVIAPLLAGRLTIDHAELRVPERLPQNVQPVSATIIDSATGQVLSKPKPAANARRFALALDVAVTIPGQVFVRGRGLDSEWRGKLAIAGTTAAPLLTGRLEVVRGTYDFLGKTAVLSRGTISFLGGQMIDPGVDIEAHIASSDVTAIVQITGTARQPKITLSSQPELPQDEILSRVLFGTNIAQLGPGQAIEIAQAAAALATGGGPGVIDRIRRTLGLDRLSFGTAQANTPFDFSGSSLPSTPGIPGQPSSAIGTSPLPVGATSPTATTGAAAVSAGKYVANGVYVGVTQGLTAASSSVNVQIDVTRHITLDTTAGEATGAGVGVTWKLDY